MHGTHRGHILISLFGDFVHDFFNFVVLIQVLPLLIVELEENVLDISSPFDSLLHDLTLVALSDVVKLVLGDPG